LESISKACDAFQAKKLSLLQEAQRRQSNKRTKLDTYYLRFARQLLRSVTAKGIIDLNMDGIQTWELNAALLLTVRFKEVALQVT
jgi:hypothetical protein